MRREEGGEGETPVRFIQIRTGRISAIFCGIFRDFSPRIRIGGRGGGGWTAAITGDGHRRGSRGGGSGGGGGARRERGVVIYQRG